MSDERLARRAAAGDRTAFESIFRRYHQDLYRYCLATVGNPQDAQEALQNTMVKAMQALPGERREIRLRPWLYRVARNEAVETLRRRREGTELDPEREAMDWEIAESTAMRERLRQLFSDLEELPERQRAALVMRELAGLEFEEIGSAFGTSPAVVRQTLYEARLSLRQMDEGREMSCETVTKALSDADGRVTRRRDLRAHLRGCASCRAFRDEIGARRGEFAAISPLPLALSAGLLSALGGGQAGAVGAAGGAASNGGASAVAAGSAGAAGAGGGAAGVTGAVGAGIGKTVAAATVAKSAAAVAVVAAVGVSAADRGGVIDLPLGDDRSKAAKTAPQLQPSAEGEGSNTAASGVAEQAAGSGGERAATTPDGEVTGSAAPAGGKDVSSKAVDRGQNPGVQGSSGKPQTAPGDNSKRESQGGTAGTQGQSQAGKQEPPGPPETSGAGQETAAGRKPPQAESPPAPASPPPPPAAKPEQSPKGEGATFAPASPQAKAPDPSKGNSGGKGAPGGSDASAYESSTP